MNASRTFFGGIQATDLLRRMLPGGAEASADLPAFLAAHGDDGATAMIRDADGTPLTEAGFARVRRLPPVQTLRQALGLSQEDFAARFQIPLDVLVEWEDGTSEPDQAARAYLKVIARDPDAVRNALETDISIA